jgi:Uma2 family endonuclease
MVERPQAPTQDTHPQEIDKPLGEIVASGVSAEDYERLYVGHYEWVRGYVIKMSPISIRHENVVIYLRQLLNAFFALNPIGVVYGDPFVQRIDEVESRRQPDLQIILRTNPGKLTKTAMIGPADICIEVISEGTAGKDYGEKFEEYEQGGVGEYWIFDTEREEYRFFRRSEQGTFKSFYVDADGHYETPLLPKLKIHVPTLWEEELPNILQIVEVVKAMMEEK